MTQVRGILPGSEQHTSSGPCLLSLPDESQASIINLICKNWRRPLESPRFMPIIFEIQSHYAEI